MTQSVVMNQDQIKTDPIGENVNISPLGSSKLMNLPILR